MNCVARSFSVIRNISAQGTSLLSLPNLPSLQACGAAVLCGSCLCLAIGNMLTHLIEPHMYVVLLPEAGCKSLRCLVHPTTVLGTGRYHHPHCVCQSSRTEERLRTYSRSPQGSRSPTLRSGLPNSQAGVLFPAGVLPALFGSHVIRFSAHQPTLVTYACPGIWYPSLPTKSISRVTIYPISHSKLEDLKGGPLFSTRTIIYVHK